MYIGNGRDYPEGRTLDEDNDSSEIETVKHAH